MFLLTITIFAIILVGQTSASAIPVWELLSKEEKMSYLYSMFANQVEEYCEFSELEKCNQQLLKHGLKKLKGMPEDHLDSMDPYQRGANNIIWDSMMEGHAMKKTTMKMRSTTTPKPNSYDDNLSFSTDDLNVQGSASAKIDNVYRVPPPKGFVYITPTPSSFQYNINSGNPEYKQPQNGRPLNNIPFENILKSPVNYFVQNAPLTGPMVIRVYPDGRPVQEESSSIPQDEDLKHYKMSQIRLPPF